jgi:hypothetical protein
MKLNKELEQWLDKTGILNKVAILKEETDWDGKTRQVIKIEGIDCRTFYDINLEGRSPLYFIDGQEIKCRKSRYLTMSLPTGFTLRIDHKYPKYHLVSSNGKTMADKPTRKSINLKYRISMTGCFEKDGDFYIDTITMELRIQKQNRVEKQKRIIDER